MLLGDWWLEPEQSILMLPQITHVLTNVFSLDLNNRRYSWWLWLLYPWRMINFEIKKLLFFFLVPLVLWELFNIQLPQIIFTLPFQEQQRWHGRILFQVGLLLCFTVLVEEFYPVYCLQSLHWGFLQTTLIYYWHLQSGKLPFGELLDI